jgi:hypothetical protein
MPSTKGKSSEHVAMGEGRGLYSTMLPRTRSTSNRCRATHDVPYTLRCVLDVSHDVDVTTLTDVHQYQPHRDKNGREW